MSASQLLGRFNAAGAFAKANAGETILPMMTGAAMLYAGITTATKHEEIASSGSSTVVTVGKPILVNQIVGGAVAVAGGYSVVSGMFKMFKGGKA